MDTMPLSAADVGAVVGNNRGYDEMYGDGMWFWIIIILFAFWGNGFNRNNGMETDIDTRFIERDIFNTNQNVSNTACQTQRDVLESRYTTQLGLTELGANMQNCCLNFVGSLISNGKKKIR